MRDDPGREPSRRVDATRRLFLVAIQGAGRVVHLKGQVALDREGRIVGRAIYRAQIQKTLESIRSSRHYERKDRRCALAHSLRDRH